jgi:uncharacterized membrane protein YhaH (DUF805 family)
MEWMLMPLRRYADFSGRSRRLEFWMFQLLNMIVGLVIIALVFSSVPWDQVGDPAVQAGPPAQPGPLFWVGLGLTMVWSLGSLIPGLAVQIRRLHDTDRSGWWWFLNFVPFGGFVLLVFMLLEGTPGENSYGPDPKGPGAFD